jgi:hypothetical protein
MFLASARIRAHVNSAGGSDRLAVPHTTTPCACAAAKSMEAFRIPVVTSSFRCRSRSNTDAGNGVRSRMMTTIWQSPMAPASCSSSLKWWWIERTSTSPMIGDQSVDVRAACW